MIGNGSVAKHFTTCNATAVSDVRCERRRGHDGLHQYTYLWRGDAATRTPTPPRWRPSAASVLAGLVAWLVLALAYSTVWG